MDDEPSQELVERANALVANAQLRNVRPTAIRASVEENVPPGTRAKTSGMDISMSYSLGDGLYANKFDYHFDLAGTDSALHLGTIDFSLILVYDISKDFIFDSEAAEFLAGTTGLFASYPYARELVQSLSARMQLEPMVLGLLKKDDLPPPLVAEVLAQQSEPE